MLFLNQWLQSHMSRKSVKLGLINDSHPWMRRSQSMEMFKSVLMINHQKWPSEVKKYNSYWPHELTIRDESVNIVINKIKSIGKTCKNILENNFYSPLVETFFPAIHNLWRGENKNFRGKCNIDLRNFCLKMKRF